MADFIRGTLLFPIIQSTHLIGLSLLVGTIALVDFRLTGWGLRRHSIAGLAKGLRPWTTAGLAAMAITGPLMFWADTGRYTRNSAFLVKMGLLALTLAYHFTIHRNVTLRADTISVSRQQLAAALSLILWSAVVLAGRAIADFDAV
jgi:hypothetical protein